ncbi:MAG: methylenetetrahydrofolate reductase C-terminal domain-containing protein [Deltaproteobacteria bacterium]|nr:methylenetetrahydrofolate reductase C-terminal domain-containing protein [Deltaproteobacteria bacterium]
MIITKKKDFQKILEYLKNKNKIFLYGCNSCAEQCETGGEKEIKEMTLLLENAGKNVTGFSLPDETCYSMIIKKDFREQKKTIEGSDAILVLACGAGVKAVSDTAGDEKPVFPALDSLYLANVTRYGHFFEGCALCGECVLGETGGICPHTNCPKGLLNGPCGGMADGKCEVNIENDCVWVRIYTRLKKQGRLDVLKKIAPAKDYSSGVRPRNTIVESRIKNKKQEDK